MSLTKEKLNRIHAWMLKRLSEPEKTLIAEKCPSSLRTNGMYGEVVPRLEKMISVLSENDVLGDYYGARSR